MDYHVNARFDHQCIDLEKIRIFLLCLVSKYLVLSMIYERFSTYFSTPNFFAYWFSRSKSLNIIKYFGIMCTLILISSYSLVSYSSQFYYLLPSLSRSLTYDSDPWFDLYTFELSWCLSSNLLRLLFPLLTEILYLD